MIPMAISAPRAHDWGGGGETDLPELGAA